MPAQDFEKKNSSDQQPAPARPGFVREPMAAGKAESTLVGRMLDAFVDSHNPNILEAPEGQLSNIMELLVLSGMPRDEAEKLRKGELFTHLDKALLLMMHRLSPALVIQGSPGSEPFPGLPGEVALSNPACKIQVHDPDGYVKTRQVHSRIIQELLRTAELFTPSVDLFKAHIPVSESMISVCMDPGKHKENLLFYIPESGHISLFYVHSERNSGEHQRGAYVRGALEHLHARIMEDGNATIGLSPSVHYCDIPGFFRLCKSVKDLDLSLRPQHLKFAVSMFSEGATNMERFLTACESVDKSLERGAESEIPEGFLNPRELEMIQEYSEHAGKLAAYKQHMLKTILRLRRAKALNFEVLADLAELQTGVMDAWQAGFPTKRVDPVSRFFEIIEKIRKMCDLAGAIRLENLKQRFYPAVEQCGFQLKFGPTSEWSLGRPFPKDLKNFMEMFADRGGELASLKDVDTIEELVRFLHAETVRHKFERNYDAESSPFDSRQISMEGGPYIRIIDISSPGEFGGRMLSEFSHELKSVGEELLRLLAKPMCSMSRPWSAIATDDTLELSLPFGKHYAEIKVDRDEPNGKYTIRIFYVESGYDESDSRITFVKNILRRLGYSVIPSRTHSGTPVFSAAFQSEKEEEAKNAFAKSSRMLFSTMNMDIGMKLSRFHESLFEHGVTNFLLARRFYSIMSGEPDVRDFLRIMEIGSKREKSLAIRAILERCDFLPSKLVPFFEPLDRAMLGHVMDKAFNMEMEAKDKKEKGKFRRILNMAEKLSDKKENPQ